MKNAGQFRVGTQFIGNVNNAEMEITKIEKKSRTSNNGKIYFFSAVASIKNKKTGKIFTSGLDTLERCDVDIIKY